MIDFVFLHISFGWSETNHISLLGHITHGVCHRNKAGTHIRTYWQTLCASRGNDVVQKFAIEHFLITVLIHIA